MAFDTRALPQHSEHHAYTALAPDRFKGYFSRLITRTRISSDREGCRVGVAQLGAALFG